MQELQYFYYRETSAVWQLPTYSGTKSYQNLLGEVYGITSENRDWQIWNGSYMGTTLQGIPISFILNGIYSHDTGSINNLNSYGYYSESNSSSTIYSYMLRFYSTGINTLGISPRGTGQSLRCLIR